MATFVSPGAYIQEKDDSLYSPAISPAIIGIVGTATKGPTDEATLITSEGRLTEVFGRPRAKDLGMHAAIEALKEARIIYFIRIAGASASAGSVTVQDAGSTATAACITAGNTAPYNLISGTTEATLGTRTGDIDINYDNTGGGVLNNVSTFSFTAAQRSSQNLPAAWDFQAIAAGADVTLTVVIDGGSAQTITFTSTDFVSYSAPTIAEVLAVVNAQIQDASARAGTSDALLIQSDKYGTSSTVQVTGGTANDVTNGFNFLTTSTPGSGDGGDLTAVTIAELNTKIDTDTSSAVTVVDNGSGAAQICTVTAGSDRSIEVVSATSDLVGAAPLINWTPLDTTVNGTATGSAANTVTFTASTNGSHSSRIKVRISASAALAGTVRLEVLLDDVVQETFEKLAMGPTAPTGSNDLVTTINDGVSGVSPSELIDATDLNPTTAGNPVVGTVTLTAGDDGDNWTSSTVIGTVTGSVRTGMQIFADPDQVFINLLATPGISYSAVIAEGITICETRADCMYVVDAPTGLTPAEVVQWHNGDSSLTVTVDQEDRTEANSTVFNSSYAALYYPFYTAANKFDADGGNISLPPSGVVLRTLAFTDTVADPWFAPAGPNRTRGSSILDLEFNASQGERDVMQIQGNNVNPISIIAGIGTVIMGQKTLQRAPTALDRVNVRRLLLSLEKSVSQSVFFLIFEPNDPILWRRFVNLVEPLLRDVQSRRGLLDFRVVADSTTTTPLLQDQNTFVGKIFLKPTKAAEKIVVSFNITPSGADFSEFLSN